MASSRRSDLQQAQDLFRARQPEQALDLAQAVLRRDPGSAEAAAFVQAVLRHLDARMRQAARAGDHGEVVRLARLLSTAPEFADAAGAALVKAAVAGFPPAERAALLLQQGHDAQLPDEGLAALGSVLAALPPDRAAIDAGFVILETFPGHAATLQGMAVHLLGLGLRSEPDDDSVQIWVQRLQDRIGAATGDAAQRRLAYAAARAEQDAGSGAAERLDLEQAIRRMETQVEPAPAGAATVTNVWSLLDESSDAYVFRDPPQPTPTARAVLATPAAPRHRALGQGIARARIIFSLWSRGINFEASQDRIGYLWLVLDPLIHILIICAVPLFLHADHVYDMPTLAFGVMGATFWMSFRAAATGALAGGGVLKSQLEHPSVRRFDIIVARGMNALVVYFLVGAVLIGQTILWGTTALPMNLPLFLALFMLVWAMGLSYGIIVTSLVLRYPGVRRINGFLTRAIAFTSGLFYVTEQLPDELTKWLLWNPVLHVIQLARSAWFAEYQTRHADPVYVLFAALVLMALALSCLALDERRPESVRA